MGLSKDLRRAARAMNRLSGVNDHWLYHVTTPWSAVDILKSNVLEGGTNNGEHEDTVYRQSGVSLTRSPYFAANYNPQDKYIIFRLNGQKLRQRAKMIPRNWYSEPGKGGTEESFRRQYRWEAEEFVPGDITNFKTYLDAIVVPKWFEEALTSGEYDSDRKWLVPLAHSGYMADRDADLILDRFEGA